jgi:hypothetical protein
MGSLAETDIPEPQTPDLIQRVAKGPDLDLRIAGLIASMEEKYGMILANAALEKPVETDDYASVMGMWHGSIGFQTDVKEVKRIVEFNLTNGVSGVWEATVWGTGEALWVDVDKKPTIVNQETNAFIRKADEADLHSYDELFDFVLNGGTSLDYTNDKFELT